ncbi:MAG: hypothetical protein JSW58_15850 [Candidatus Latescibacterota bacterium]|nr:MAG: hypothetical protein JSW58_15850 [Candidatus Latescibacterota bacterium]
MVYSSYFWRVSGGSEIDFVAHGLDGIFTVAFQPGNWRVLKVMRCCRVINSVFHYNSPTKILFLALFGVCLVACAGSHTVNTDFEHADLMLEFLRNMSEGELDSVLVDTILETKGMDLIIEQQNRRARINKAQYRTLLSSLLNDEVPDIEPVDSTERAKLGVRRLRANVWPALKWAIDNVDLLEERLAFLRDLNVGSRAKKLADSFLPQPLRSIPKIFFVVGGRAGYYAGDDCIYMDLLNMSYSPKGVKPLVESKIIDFFAHEMHHVGYQDLRNKILSQLSLNETHDRAFGFVSGLVAEGSATYLINGHCDIDLIKNDRRYAEYFTLENDLREISEGILNSILDGHIENEDDYSKATEQLLGMGYHSAGSLIMHVIYQADGLEAIMEVLQDPRRLFVEYNKAAEGLMAKPGSDSLYLFDEDLVEMVAHMGQ